MSSSDPVGVTGVYYLYGSTLYRIARDAYASAVAMASEEDEPTRNHHVVVSVVFSAAALEAFVNELLHWANVSLTSPRELRSEWVGTFRDTMERLTESKVSTVGKYFIAKARLPGEPFDPGAAPMQDVKLLFTIRNLLVHMTPHRAGKKQNILRGLETRGLLRGIRPDILGEVDWLYRISTPAMAQWACDTVSETVDAFGECFTDDRGGNFAFLARQHMKRFPKVSLPEQSERGDNAELGADQRP